MPKLAMKISGIVFLMVALVHLSRLILKFEVVIAGQAIPLWANGIGLAVSLGLSLWLFVGARRLN